CGEVSSATSGDDGVHDSSGAGGDDSADERGEDDLGGFDCAAVEAFPPEFPARIDQGGDPGEHHQPRQIVDEVDQLGGSRWCSGRDVDLLGEHSDRNDRCHGFCSWSSRCDADSSARAATSRLIRSAPARWTSAGTVSVNRARRGGGGSYGVKWASSSSSRTRGSSCQSIRYTRGTRSVTVAA